MCNDKNYKTYDRQQNVIEAQEENFSRQCTKIRSKHRTMQTLNCIEN
jgi:hypothetical protein